MKRALLFFLTAVLLLQVTGCGGREIMTTDTDRINEMSQEIIRCLVEKDKDALEKLFCSRVRETADFQTQINALYGFFDYDFYTRCDLDGNRSQHQAKEFGKRTEWSVNAEIVYIEVCDENGGLFYGIQYQWTPVYEENAQLVGLHTLNVYLINTENSACVGTDQDYPFTSE